MTQAASCLGCFRIEQMHSGWNLSTCSLLDNADKHTSSVLYVVCEGLSRQTYFTQSSEDTSCIPHQHSAEGCLLMTQRLQKMFHSVRCCIPGRNKGRDRPGSVRQATCMVLLRATTRLPVVQKLQAGVVLLTLLFICRASSMACCLSIAPCTLPASLHDALSKVTRSSTPQCK